MDLTTTNDWLPVLSKRIDERAERVARLRSYASGDAPMPEMSQNTREAWSAFQKKARGSFGYLISAALVNRMVPLGVTVDGSTESTVAQAARRIWRDNRMAVQIPDALMDSAQTGLGYLAVGSEGGKAVITREAPEFMYAATDPLRPWRSRAALKMWRDEDMGRDFALVWTDGTRVRYSREIPRLGALQLKADDRGWEPDGEVSTYNDSVPVFALENRDGLGEYERHTDLIDRINLGVLNRMVVMSMQAFRQRALLGELPETDRDGNAIDWSAALQPAPGALWNLPEEVKQIWESQQTDVQPLLTAVKDDLRDLSAVSETPLASLVPDGANQTAEGAAFQREAIVAKASDRINRCRPAIEAAMVRALRVEGFNDFGTVEVQFEPPARVSLSEKYAAAVQAKAAGESRKSIQRNILGYSAEQIQQDERDMAAEQLANDLLALPVSDAGTSTAQ